MTKPHPLPIAEEMFAPLLESFRILYTSSVRDLEVKPHLNDTFERY